MTGFQDLPGIPKNCIVTGEKKCNWKDYDLKQHAKAKKNFAMKFIAKAERNVELQFQDEYYFEICDHNGIPFLQLEEDKCIQQKCDHDFSETTRKDYFNALCSFINAKN